MKQRKRGGVTIQADGLLDLFDKIKVQSMSGKVKKVVREEMRQVRKGVTDAARQAMKRDPRHAARAVKTTIYKGGKNGVLGANVNILKPRGGVQQMAVYRNPKPGGKSGIRRRRKISRETKQRAGYTGADRYFVLHWIDAGASRAKRGMIPASNFFVKSAKQQMNQATGRVIKRIRQLIKNGGK